MRGNDCIIDYPEMRKQLIERLQEIGFNMEDWHINTFNAEGENHIYTIKDKSYQSCDYIYLINKQNRKDVFYLWIDIAWTEGMKEPVLFIHVLLTELTASLIENLDDSIEEHFFPIYLVGEEVQAAKIQMVRKYSIRPLPNYKEMIKKLVTDDQYKGIMKQKHFQNRNKYYKEEA